MKIPNSFVNYLMGHLSCFCLLAALPLPLKAALPEVSETKVVRQLVAQISEDSSQRSNAVQLLIQRGVSVVPEVAALTGSKDSGVRGAANQVIQGLGFDRSVDHCVSNLNSPDENVRYQCAVALTFLTNHHFGYSASDDAETRVRIISKWRTWLASKRSVSAVSIPKY